MFDKRIEQINYVVNNAEHVKINYEKLDELADSLKDVSFSEHPWLKYKNELSEKELIMLSFFLESMNFCFWKEPRFRYKDQKNSGAMMSIFIDAVMNNKMLLDSKYILDMKYEDFILLFGVEEANLRKRFDSIRYTAKKIDDNVNFFDDLFSIKSVDELYKFITSFENFNDVAMYKGKEIYFYKRATLLVHDLFDLSDTIHTNLGNMDSVLGCADYIIPRGFRLGGVLEYDSELSSMVDNYVEIPEVSEYEVEIRAFTLYVIEYVKNKNDKSVNSAVWDNLIWNFYRGKGGIAHRTDTIFY